MRTAYDHLMGKVVQVVQLLERHITYPGILSEGEDAGYEVTWTTRENPRPRAGWFVGVRFVQDGTFRRGRTTWYQDGPEDEPNFLDIKHVIPAAMISYWPTMKPVLVPLEDKRRGCVHGFLQIGDLRPVSPAEWSWVTMKPDDREKAKEEMRRDSRSFPRNSKGRWIIASALEREVKG